MASGHELTGKTAPSRVPDGPVSTGDPVAGREKGCGTMTVRSASSSDVNGFADELDGAIPGGRILRVINGVALGVAFALAGSIMAVIVIFALAVLYAVVRMALGG